MDDATLRMCRRLAQKRDLSAANINTLIGTVPALVAEIERLRSEIGENDASRIADVIAERNAARVECERLKACCASHDVSERVKLREITDEMRGILADNERTERETSEHIAAWLMCKAENLAAEGNSLAPVLADAAEAIRAEKWRSV